MLLSELWIRIPAGVEQHEERLDVVPICNRKKSINPLGETNRVLLPKKIVKKDANRIQANRLRPSEFFVDLSRIECFGLPHFQLIDCGRRNVVASHKPRFLRVPMIRLLWRPARMLCRLGDHHFTKRQGENNCRQQLAYRHKSSGVPWSIWP